MNTYYKILFSLSIASIGLFFTEKIVSKGAKKFHAHSYQKLQTIFDSNNYYDIVFIGSSRTHNSINPRIIDSVTGFSTFNAAIDGAGLPELKMIFEGYLLKHPAPKKIVLTLDADAFDDIYKFYNHNLYLFFLKHKVVDTTLSGNGFPALRHKMFPFLRLTEMNDFARRNAIAGLSGQDELHEQNCQDKGYLANGNTCIYPELDAIYENENYRIDPKSVAMLNSMIITCKEKKIELILTYAPEYNYRLQGYIGNFNQIISMVDSTAVKNRLVFFREDRLEMCREKCFFANYGHLNTAGATEYSLLLGRRLKDSILQ